MDIQIEKEYFEIKHIEILNGLKNIRKKRNCTKIRILINDDGSGEIQAYDKAKSIGFNKVMSFKNYDELLGIFQEYYFVK